VRLGLLQLGYLAAAAIVGALLPRIQVGSVPADKVSQMLFAIAAGVLPLVAVVYSLPGSRGRLRGSVQPLGKASPP
jgi:hypothetical protein